MSFPNAESIDKRIKYLKQVVRRRQQACTDAPAGSIRAKARRGDCFYYEYHLQGEPVRYLRLQDKDDMTLAKSLAQADYNKKIIKAALEEIRLLEKVERFYEKGCAEDIYGKMAKARRSLVAPIRTSDEEYAKRWLARTYTVKNKHEENRIFETKRGEKTRSKSEVFIANELYARGIPYHYEYPVKLQDHLTGKSYTAYPDFAILDVRSRREYIYEHFGKMDDPGYATDNLAKLVDYELAGYHIGEDMIVTFETKTDPLTPERAAGIIRHCFQ